MATRTIAIKGKKIEKADITTAVPVSTVETIGLATPPVVAVDVNLVDPEALDIAVAVPPPAIIANDHVTSGFKSATVESITAVPAIAAKGIAILSSKLSTYGIKYANISTRVATPKAINAGTVPSHCQDSFNCQTSKYAAKLNANKGKKTLNPTEADKPTPKQMLIIVSVVIILVSHFLQKNHL